MLFVLTLSLFAASLHSSAAVTCTEIQTCAQDVQQLMSNGGNPDMAEVCKLLPNVLTCLQEALADCKNNPDIPEDTFAQVEASLPMYDDMLKSQCEGQGVPYVTSQDADYSDCVDYRTIIEGCSKHLDYITDEGVRGKLQSLSEVDDPIFLLKADLDTVCGTPENQPHLKEYFTCVFGNLTVCLKRQNKTKILMPDASKIAVGVERLCEHKDHINVTCILERESAVKDCYGSKVSTDDDQCFLYEKLTKCTVENMMDCDGGKYIADYVKDARPQLCDGTTGSGSRNVAAVSALLLAVLCSVFLGRM